MLSGLRGRPGGASPRAGHRRSGSGWCSGRSSLSWSGLVEGAVVPAGKVPCGGLRGDRRQIQLCAVLPGRGISNLTAPGRGVAGAVNMRIPRRRPEGKDGRHDRCPTEESNHQPGSPTEHRSRLRRIGRRVCWSDVISSSCPVPCRRERWHQNGSGVWQRMRSRRSTPPPRPSADQALGHDSTRRPGARPSCPALIRPPRDTDVGGPSGSRAGRQPSSRGDQILELSEERNER